MNQGKSVGSGATSGLLGSEVWLVQLERRLGELELWRGQLERAARRRRLYYLIAIAVYLLLTYFTMSSLGL
ncbi:MAG: hypothetical protein HOP15_06015 [Planctomycetes bacterium]|nr:hypothetical protein [Planctomycetota bacterium]